MRTICIAPPGVATNIETDDIIEDTKVVRTKGVLAPYYNWKRFVIFLDVVGFVGEYHASSVDIDFMSHSAYTPCTHRIFRVVESPERDSVSHYSRTTTVKSAKSSFSGGKGTMEALKNCDISKDDRNILGMNHCDYSDVQQPGVWYCIRLTDTIPNIIPSGGDIKSGNPLYLNKFDT